MKEVNPYAAPQTMHATNMTRSVLLPYPSVKRSRASVVRVMMPIRSSSKVTMS